MLSHERYCFGESTLLRSQQDVFFVFFVFFSGLAITERGVIP